MTPQDKARELVRKFIPHSRMLYDTHGRDGFILSAKQCALIAVDEILLSVVETDYDIFKDNGQNFKLGYKYYWECVKQELEKL